MVNFTTMRPSLMHHHRVGLSPSAWAMHCPGFLRSGVLLVGGFERSPQAVVGSLRVSVPSAPRPARVGAFPLAWGSFEASCSSWIPSCSWRCNNLATAPAHHPILFPIPGIGWQPCVLHGSEHPSIWCSSGRLPNGRPLPSPTLCSSFGWGCSPALGHWR